MKNRLNFGIISIRKVIGCLRMIKKSHILLLFLIILSVDLSNPNGAEQPKISKPASDVRVLVDMSGSMKKNDPNNLRVPAVQLMSNLLPPDSQAGVWTFGQYVNMLVPLSEVNKKWKKQAVEAAKNINSLGLFTNIGGAMEHASYGWKIPDPDIKRSLILLTDGMVDVSKDGKKNAAARRTVLRELLPRYKAAGITIHTIALSGDADEKLLSEMAVETDGWYQKVMDASELQRVFLKIFEQATERDSIPLKDNRFSIDEQIDEFTLLVFKKQHSKPTIIEQPDGEVYDAGIDSERLTWFEATDYDLVTINSPMAGEWRVIVDMDPDNRVLIVSNLSLKTTAMPNNLLANEKFIFKMQMLQDDVLVTNKDFLKLLTMEVELLTVNGSETSYKLMDDGKGVDQNAGDGIYSIEIIAPAESGVTQLSGLVNSPTFQRMRQQATNIFNSPIAIEEILSDTIEVDHKLLLEPIVGISKPDSLQINAEATLPDGQQLSIDAEFEKGYTQAITLPVVATGGDYHIQLDVHGETPAGREFQVAVAPYIFTTDAVILETKPEPEKEIVEQETPEVSLVEKPEVVEDEESNILMWIIVGLVANILLFVLGWLVYKKINNQNVKLADELSEQLE